MAVALSQDPSSVSSSGLRPCLHPVSAFPEPAKAPGLSPPSAYRAWRGGVVPGTVLGAVLHGWGDGLGVECRLPYPTLPTEAEEPVLSKPSPQQLLSIAGERLTCSVLPPACQDLHPH